MSITIDYFFNSDKELPELKSDFSNWLGMTLEAYEGDETDGNYSAQFTGIEPGSYELIVYAEDQKNNLNSTLDIPMYIQFTILSPGISTPRPDTTSVTLPYNVIRVSGDIGSATALKGVQARLNIPDGFIFTSETNQFQNIGDINDGGQATVSWLLSAPIQEGDYILNITYNDEFSNSWTSPNTDVQVTLDMGSGGSAPIGRGRNAQ